MATASLAGMTPIELEDVRGGFLVFQRAPTREQLDELNRCLSAHPLWDPSRWPGRGACYAAINNATKRSSD